MSEALILSALLSGAGMSARVALHGDELRVHVDAPGPGWVVVGLNDRPGLAGSQLAMVAVLPDGRVVSEHHVADPPNHARVPSRWIRSATGTDGDRTRVDLVLAGSGPDAAVALRPGERVWVTLAWSRSDDLQHHSAQRTEVIWELAPTPQ